MSANIPADTEENEKRVRAFYEATVPGHREALTFASLPRSSLPRARKLSRSVVSKEKLEKQPCPSMCLPPTSGQSARDISNDCVLSPTQQC